MGSTVSCGASAVAGGIFSNAAGIRVVPWVPTGRWDISRVYRREESRSAAVGSRGLGKKNPAGIVRGITDCMDARGYNCSCQFWLAGCRKMKPTQSAKDNDGSVLLGNICCFCKGPALVVPPALHDYDLLPGWWQGLKLRSDSHCAGCGIQKSNDIHIQKELSPMINSTSIYGWAVTRVCEKTTAVQGPPNLASFEIWGKATYPCLCISPLTI